MSTWIVGDTTARWLLSTVHGKFGGLGRSPNFLYMCMYMCMCMYMLYMLLYMYMHMCIQCCFGDSWVVAVRRARRDADAGARSETAGSG